MKTKQIIQKLQFYILLTSCVVYLGGCTNSNDSKKVAEKQNDEKFSKDQEDDAQFLVDVATINMEEIQMGNLAKSKGMTKDVQNLGQMMVDDHTQANQEVAALAGRKGVTIPTTAPDKVSKDADNLNDKTGYDFDKKFCKKMIDGHQDAIDKFQKAAKDSKDDDIRNFANSMLPKLQSHLEQAKNCEKIVTAQANGKNTNN